MTNSTPPGMGAPPPTGLGCPDGPALPGVMALLAAGSPRLAYARAVGIPFAPYLINVTATFPDTTTAIVPDVGSDTKIYQDTLIDSLKIAVINTSDTANQNTFQAQSDFYFAQQSTLRATLSVQGAPRYEVASKPTLLSQLADMIGPPHWPGGWILTYQQQLFMTFEVGEIALPFAPYTVVCCFRGWLPVVDTLVQMSNTEALNKLAAVGVKVPSQYVTDVMLR